jgi:hypothetical protein
MSKINRTGPNPPNPSFRNGPQRQSGTGGGANYSQPPIRGGSPNTRVVSVSQVSNIGGAVGNKVMGQSGTTQRPDTPMWTERKDFVEMGNTLAERLGTGVGVGYVVHRSGSQGRH